MARKKRAAEKDLGSLNEETSPSTKKSKKLDSRFGGMTEEEVAKLLLPDHMRPGLDIIFVSLPDWAISVNKGNPLWITKLFTYPGEKCPRLLGKTVNYGEFTEVYKRIQRYH